MSDTIAAISTGGVVSAIGIIRLSGDDAIEIVSKVFKPSFGGAMDTQKDRKLVLGDLYDAEGCIIDNCLCTISRGPDSYTGENTAELQCHGSPMVLNEGLRSLFRAGARQAKAGEFTKRAFLNGRMDLTQAEAVIDLIESETAECARNAAGQLGGAVSRRTDAIYDSLCDMSAHFQAVIDYPDEDIDEFRLAGYIDSMKGSAQVLKDLLSTFERGSVMKTGTPAAIIGRPNSGKSSLLNALLGYDRAIVTANAGTTRDTLEERIRIGGVLVRLTDTAGIRDAEDEAEKIGVERAKMAAKASRIVIAVFDGSEPLTAEDAEVINEAKACEKRIAVINKSDLGFVIDEKVIADAFDTVCRISAKTGDGVEALSDAVAALTGGTQVGTPGEILTNSRQASAVELALQSLEAAIDAAESGVTPDAVLTETEEAMSALGELSGRTVKDEIVDRIFSRFCVGK